MPISRLIPPKVRQVPRRKAKRDNPPADRRGWSIRAYLVALALISTLPIAIVAGFFAYHLVSDSSQRARSDFEERLRLLRSAVELRIANIIEDAELLARSPDLQAGNFAQFRGHATQAVEVARAFGLIVSDRDGQILLNTRGPDVPLRRRLYVDAMNRVLATGRPQVSDLNISSADGEPFISIEVPVRAGGEIRYVLAIGLSPAYFSTLMDEYVPPGYVGSIIDRKGTLIARRPLEQGVDLVGRRTIPEVLSHVGEPSAFWIETRSRSGVPYYSSFIRSERSGWSMNLALPRSMVDEPLRRAAFVFEAVALAALLTSLVLALLLARRFLQGFTSLERHVTQLGTDRIIDPTPGPVAEVNRMEAVLRRVGMEIAEVEEAIERERSLLRATVDTIPIGVLLVTADGRISLVNRKMLSMCGADRLRSLDDPERFSYARPDGTLYSPPDLPITRALEHGETIEGEEAVHTVGGVARHEVINAAPVRDGSGEVIAAVSACYDVTELRTAMNRQKILLDEINHRVKNTLATVQSIARVSLASATTLREYSEAFEERLIALSRAYNLLTENNWEGADFRTIAERTLAPFASNGRTSMTGPRLRLSPKVTLAMSAAIQELSTNAAKYGALSADSGRLDVTWSRETDGRIAFNWVERDGPPVRAPTRRGFGTRLIQDILAAESGWTVTLDYAPAGLRCTMSIAAMQA
jgi:PAS domain S-box-containing protein